MQPRCHIISWRLTPSFRSEMKYSSLCGIGTSMSCSPAHPFRSHHRRSRESTTQVDLSIGVPESKRPPEPEDLGVGCCAALTVCEEHGRLDVGDVRDRAALPVELMLPTDRSNIAGVLRRMQPRWQRSWGLTPTAFLQTRTRTEAGTSMCRLATMPQATGGQGTSSLERRETV